MFRRTSVGIGAGLLALSLLSSPSRADAPGKIKFCSDLQFTTCKDTVAPGEEVYVRAEFGKSIAEVFKDSLGLPEIPSSGKFIFLIGKSADDANPIIRTSGNVMVSRYEKTNTFDLTMQASEEQVEKIAASGPDIEKVLAFNSIGTMGDKSLTTVWMQKAATLKSGNTSGEAFLIFLPSYGDQPPKTVATGKFTYAMGADGRKKLAANMNMYDKQRFEATPDDGVTTNLHKANVGKVVFARTKMKKGHDQASDLVTSVKSLGEGLYARMYLKQSMRNTMAELGGGKDVSDTYYATNLSVDDGKIKRTIEQKLSKDEALRLTSWSLTLVPGSAADAGDMPDLSQKFVYLVSMLEPGKHKIWINSSVTVADQNTEISAGTIEFTLTAADRDAIAKKWGNRLAKRGLLDSDKALEGQIKAVLGKSIVQVAAPLAWELRKNGLGMVTHRVTQIETGYKDKGECRRGVEMIQQDKQGAGFGPTHRSVEKSWSGVETDLPCQNLGAK